MSQSDLPAPLVPASMDLRDVPIPREFFARLAVREFGISYEEAIAFANAAADRIEANLPLDDLLGGQADG